MSLLPCFRNDLFVIDLWVLAMLLKFFFFVFLPVTSLCTIKMKAGTSTLNPYAQSYIPLSKRGPPDGNKDFKSSGTETGGAKLASSMGSQPWDPTAQAQQSYMPSGADAFSSTSHSKLKYTAQEFQSSSLHNHSELEKAILDEEFDMDLAYLQTLFPGISDESLSDVYFANKGDVDATVDMLNHLEVSV